MTNINAAQEYSDRTMYYSVRLKGHKQLVTSKRECIDYSFCEAHGIELSTQSVTVTRFSEEAVEQYLQGRRSATPKDVFNQVLTYIERFALLADDNLYSLVALWVLGTYMFRVFRYYPYIHLNAEKGSGKTTLMELLAPIGFNGDFCSDATGAALCREVNNNSSTIFLDEMERVVPSVLRLLNAGFSKVGTVKRKENSFNVYSPKMFASINPINDVLADRAITIRMKRRLEGESVERYLGTEAVMQLQSDIRDSLYLFGLEYATVAAVMYADDVPELAEFTNRTWDLWAPLIIVGKVVGADVGAVVKLAQRLNAEKASSDEGVNDTVRVLAVVNAMIHDMDSVKKDEGGDQRFYDPNMVLAYFRAQGVLGQDATQTSLGRLLNHKLEIVSRPERVEGILKRLYVVDLETLEDYSKRYLPQKPHPLNQLRLAAANR